MTTRTISSISSFVIPGIEHQSLAGPADGLRQLEVWSQRVAPGGATPMHRHDCEEVIVVLEGRGRYETPTSAEDFVAPAVLTVAANAVYQITNTGDGPMRLLAALSMAPVVVRTATGEVIPLPWGVAS